MDKKIIIDNDLGLKINSEFFWEILKKQDKQTMNSTWFHEYYKRKISYYKSEEQEIEKAVYKEEIERLTKICNKIEPRIGTPFNFFIWYFEGGYKDYYEYWKDLDFIYTNAVSSNLNDVEEWTITDLYPGPPEEVFETFNLKLKDDLHNLFQVEFRKVVQIYSDRWNSVSNKEEFLSSFQADRNFIRRKFPKNIGEKIPNGKIKEVTSWWVDNFIPLLNVSVRKLTESYFAEELLIREKTSRKKKETKTRTENDIFKIDSDKAKELYKLSIPRSEDNGTFIKAEESDSHTQFQKILSTYDYTGPTFKFDFETKYVAFVLRWLQVNKKFPNAFPVIECMNCFTTKHNTLVTATNLRNAFSKDIKPWEKLLHRNYAPKNYNLPDEPTLPQILIYLSCELKKIFFPESQ